MSEYTIADIEPGKYADVMPDMSEEKYKSVKKSIQQNGYDDSEPVVVDAEGNIVDGHHRYKICKELGVEPSIMVDENASFEKAYRKNLARRNLDGGELRETVRSYLKEFYDGNRSQRELAGDLGVSQATINRALSTLNPPPSGDSGESPSSITDSKSAQSGDSSDNEGTKDRKQQAREYLAENPDASNREVARNIEADVSHVTVGTWREEWEAPPEEDADDEADAEPEPPTDATADDAPAEAEGDPGPEATPETIGASEADPTTADVDTTTPDGAADPEPEPATPDTDAGPGEPTSAAIGYVDDLEADLEACEEERDRLRDVANRRQARAEELEGLLRDVVRAVDNQDTEAIQRTAERAEEFL